MAITVTRSKLVLILVIVFTVLVAAAAVGTAVLLNQRNVGTEKSKAALACNPSTNLVTDAPGCAADGVGLKAGNYYVSVGNRSGIEQFIDAGFRATVTNSSTGQPLPGASVRMVGAGKIGFSDNSKYYGTVGCNPDGDGTPASEIKLTNNTLQSGATDASGQAGIGGAANTVNCFNAPYTAQVGCPAGFAPDTGYGTNGCRVEKQPTCTNGNQEKDLPVTCRCIPTTTTTTTTTTSTTITTTTPTTPPTTPTQGNIELWARCVDGTQGGTADVTWGVFNGGNVIVNNQTFNGVSISSNPVRIATQGGLTDGVRYNVNVGVAPRSGGIYVSGFADNCQSATGNQLTTGQKCTILFSGCSGPTTTPPPPPTFSVRVNAVCIRNDGVELPLDGSGYANAAVYDSAAPAYERLNKPNLPYTFNEIVQFGSNFYIATWVNQINYAGTVGTLTNDVRINGTELRTGALQTVVRNYQTGSGIAPNKTVYEFHAANGIGSFGNNQNASLTFIYRGCNPPITTTPVTTTPPQYQVSVNAVCTDNGVSRVVTAPITYNSQSYNTPQSFGPFPQGTTGTVTCGSYADPISGTTRQPAAASMNFSISNNLLTCQYSGCVTQVTTTPPTTTVTTTTPSDRPSLIKISLGGTNQTYAPGDYVTYRVSVVNPTGTALTGVNIVDTPAVPYSTYFDPSTFESLTTLNSGETVTLQNPGFANITWANLTVPANTTRNFEFRMRLRSTLTAMPPTCNITMVNTASITIGGGSVTTPPNTTTTITIQIPLSQCQEAGLDIVKTVNPAYPNGVAPGGTFNISLRVRNTADPATSTQSRTVNQVTDFMPAGFTYAGSPAVTLSSGATATVAANTDSNANSVVFTLNGASGVVLQPGQYLTITFRMTAPSADQCTIYVNRAQVTNPTPGPEARANMYVCRLPQTGIFDNVIFSVLLGGGLIGMSYLTYRYNVIEKIATKIKTRKK